MTLPIRTALFELRFHGTGPLLPWLGLALRGAAARHLKNRVCRWPPQQRDSRWRQCRGCPHLEECAYGLIYEPDPPANGEVLRLASDGFRAIALAPSFSPADRSHPELSVPVRLVLTGQRAASWAEEIIAAIAHAAYRLGHPRKGIPFTLIPLGGTLSRYGGTHLLQMRDLPATPDAVPGRLPWLRIELTSPLLLKQEIPVRSKKQVVLQPTFGHLFRAALRTVGRAFAEGTGHSLETVVDFAALKSAAAEVPTLEDHWQRFTQPHISYRSGNRHPIVGVTGGAVFGMVPLAFVPWLLWAGRLGVGEFRVAGAGTWSMEIA